MEGAANRHKREFELAITQAWHGEAFARTKLLKGLGDYLKRPKKAQTPDQMLAALKMYADGGAPLNIRTLN
jgi:hypothetical protein